jgi:nucleoside-diphosphate-sugar epimerase
LNLKKKILIVGGTGFIGYHVAKKSLLRGWKVTSISSRSPQKIRYLSKVCYIRCDITKKKLLKKKINKPFDYVVNLGGYVDHSNKKRTFKSHYEGCKNLAEIFLNKSLISFVQIGTSLEYGKSYSPQKETNKCDLKSIKSIYGKAKLKASRHMMNLFNKKKFPCTVLRLYLSYGPRQDINRFLPIIIEGCIRNKKFPCSKGNQLRDFIHVEDVANAIIKSLTNKNARGQIINIGSGKPKRIKNVIEYVKKISKGGYPQYGKFKLRKFEISKLYPSIKKAKNIINWKPKIPFDSGIKSTIKFYNEYTTR